MVAYSLPVLVSHHLLWNFSEGCVFSYVRSRIIASLWVVFWYHTNYIPLSDTFLSIENHCRQHLSTHGKLSGIHIPPVVVEDSGRSLPESRKGLQEPDLCTNREKDKQSTECHHCVDEFKGHAHESSQTPAPSIQYLLFVHHNN